MRYFKVMSGYDTFIPIDETELEKAIYAQIVGKIVATFKNGSIVGSRIDCIVPDYHRAMGWNYAHRMGPDDYDQIKKSGVGNEYLGFIGSAKDKVNELMQSGQVALIGKPEN